MARRRAASSSSHATSGGYRHLGSMTDRPERNRGLACSGFEHDAHSVAQHVMTSSLTPSEPRATSAGPMKRFIVVLALFGALFGFPQHRAWADDEEGGGEHEAPAA